MRYDSGQMRKPKLGKPRKAAGAFSLSRKLPKLALPGSSATSSSQRPKPKLGRPGRSVFTGKGGGK